MTTNKHCDMCEMLYKEIDLARGMLDHKADPRSISVLDRAMDTYLRNRNCLRENKSYVLDHVRLYGILRCEFGASMACGSDPAHARALLEICDRVLELIQEALAQGESCQTPES